MSTRTDRDFLQAQLIETQRFREMVGDHPIMSISLAGQEGVLQKKLDALPLGSKEARAVLFFSGEPVQGSFGIDASFVGRVLDPFQNMVMADYADRWHGTVGSRGRRAGEAHSRLLLTSLPRGSFGVELTRASSDTLFEDDQLPDTLVHVTRLVEAATQSDADFAAKLDEVAPRVVQCLRDFLEVVARGKAGLRIESGDFRCDMNPVQASEAFSRVADTTTHTEPVKICGMLKGVFLESWKYELITDENQSVSGKIDEELTETQVIECFNKRCVASLLKTTIAFKNGRVRTTHTLQGLETREEEVESVCEYLLQTAKNQECVCVEQQ